MRLKHVRVLNYKCYRDSGDVPIGETFTVIVGKNNSGKTAFLESLSRSSFVSKPHRTPAHNTQFIVPNPNSKARYSFRTSGAELLHRFLSSRNSLAVEVPPPPSHESVKHFLTEIFSRPTLDFQLERSAGAGFVSSVNPTHQTFAPSPQDFVVEIVPTEDCQSWQIGRIGGVQDTLAGFVGIYLDQSIYLFRAERMNVGISSIDQNPELLPNASNLPSVLLHLPNMPAAHDRYINLVREVFPTIYRVTSVPLGPQTAQATVIMSDSTHGEPRPGISVPLIDSGTGISQVLAILYVAVTAPAPRIIVIDEPNSFLHPGAAKKLLSILAKLDHQYIISTHSAEIIKAIDSEFLHLVEWQGTEAKFQTIDRTKSQSQRRVLDELGVSLSDVFGAENVIWVEGPTEQRCFPLLLDHLGLLSPTTAVVPLIATGDLEGRRARASLVWQVYEQLSGGSALIPPALAFSLDREGRTDAEMDDLKKRSRGTVHFLPRRTYENYLLFPDAVAAVLNEDVQLDTPITEDQVSKWLMDKYKSTKGEKPNMLDKILIRKWLYELDAPKIIKELFWDLAKTEYIKTKHSLELTRWLLNNRPDRLKRLLEYVASLVAR